MNLRIPKTKFEVMTLEENIDFIKWAYFEKEGVFSVHDFTIKLFPELAKIDSSLSKEEVYKIISDVVTKRYNSKIDLFKKEIIRYNELWSKYNDRYLSELSNYLGIKWPEDLDIIIGKVGLMPVFPRYLDNFSFSIGTDVDDWQLVQVCAHEILHFLWFEKWKEMYLESKREEFDCPHFVWQYSEMVTDPILNNKPFSEIFDFIEHGYKEFYQMYDGDSLVMDNLRNIFSDEISVEEKIEKGYSYIKNYLEKNKKISK